MYELQTVESKELLSEIFGALKDVQVFKEDDFNFLIEHKEHLAAVFENVHMWRTDTQKRSIISDAYHPTLHSKFHQAICEQKVQTDQAFYLAKDFEMKKLEIEELLIDLEELGNTPRDEVNRKRKQIEIQFKQYELKQIQIAMNYRMSEIKGWQQLEEQLLEAMRAEGMDEETIWNKNAGEIEFMFFQFLTNLQGLKNSTDGAEAHNLVALAKFGVQQAKEIGKFDEWLKRCNPAQIDSLVFLGEAKRT